MSCFHQSSCHSNAGHARPGSTRNLAWRAKPTGPSSLLGDEPAVVVISSRIPKRTPIGVGMAQCATPPSKPDGRISHIRLSSRWVPFPEGAALRLVPKNNVQTFASRLAHSRRPNRVHGGSPYGPSVLRTGHSRSVAPHPALRRRSYGSIPHDSSPHRSGLPPLHLPAFSGARAHTSKSAVSRVSKPAGGGRNCACRCSCGPPTWKSAIQQAGKPALRPRRHLTAEFGFMSGRNRESKKTSGWSCQSVRQNVVRTHHRSG